MDILKDGWDSWGEWERRWESGTLVGRRGGEGKKKKKQGKGSMMGMGRDGDGMVYVYMIVQMSINIRVSQTRRVKVFFGGKSHHVIRRKRGLFQDFFQLIS